MKIEFLTSYYKPYTGGIENVNLDNVVNVSIPEFGVSKSSRPRIL